MPKSVSIVISYLSNNYFIDDLHIPMYELVSHIQKEHSNQTSFI